MNRFKILFIIIIIASVADCARKIEFKISSPAVKGASETGYYSKLKSTGRIDAVYAAKDNEPLNTRSFPLVWTGVPKGTKVLALILDDPDAKPVMQSFNIPGDSFIHWLCADIYVPMGGIDDNASALKKPGFVQGKNSGGSTGYVGPKPPSDFPKDVKKPIVHIYRLTVYALSAPTGLKDGFTRVELEAAMKGKIIGISELFFSYSN